MATQPLTLTRQAQGYAKVAWNPLANGDVGHGVIVGQYPFQSFGYQGTPGAGFSIQWEASMDGGVTWVLIDGPFSTCPAMGTLCPPNGPYEQIRPHVTAGDGTTSVSVYLVLRETGH